MLQVRQGSCPRWLACHGYLLLAVLIFTLAAWVYWPGSAGPLLLDDKSSLDDLVRLEENPRLAMDVVFGDTSGLFGRSVSMATFVVERLLLDQGMEGSKRVNIAIHIFNSALVMWLMMLVFGHLRTAHRGWMAVLLGAVWLLHPLFVSTVLYAVQRMAIMSTLFMLLSIIAYLYWRFALIDGRAATTRLFLVIVFLSLGLLAKENAIVAVPILLTIEVLLFGFLGRDGQQLNWLRNITWSLIILGALGLIVALVIRLDSLARSYHFRPFSLEERLLTQSRIVWDYVLQLVSPDVSRMGLYHDNIVVSTSITQPPVTTFAILGWVLLLVVLILALRWKIGRIVALGAAWFLLGHSVESTVIPLELYFEHRNYFPAIGLLLVLAAVYSALVSRWRELAAPLLALFSLIPLMLAMQTSSQVQIWSSRPLLSLNHVNAHPGSARANIDMAEQLALMGQLDAALQFSARAHEGSYIERPGDWLVRDIALTCLSGHVPTEDQVTGIGVEHSQRPISMVPQLLTLVRLLQDDRCPGFDGKIFADHMASIYIVKEFKERGSANIYSSLAVLENALGRYDNALAYAEQFLVMRPGNRRGLLMKLHFATALGRENEVAQALSVLNELEQKGALTEGEMQTLRLYDKR